jgi:hypothetical protein
MPDKTVCMLRADPPPPKIPHPKVLTSGEEAEAAAEAAAEYAVPLHIAVTPQMDTICGHEGAEGSHAPTCRSHADPAMLPVTQGEFSNASEGVLARLSTEGVPTVRPNDAPMHPDVSPDDAATWDDDIVVGLTRHTSGTPLRGACEEGLSPGAASPLATEADGEILDELRESVEPAWGPDMGYFLRLEVFQEL